MQNFQISELTPWLCLLGRTAARMTQDELAEAARVSTKTIAQYEAGKTNPQRRTKEDIVAALEARGVLFIPSGDGLGPGVRLRAAESAEAP
ncbi:helix-turn-helix transcriptional regulator [Azospirillum rugosum]|uniref:Transcriptional regulator with XRE-family HTH domain n=1 Tax=Azospirillum rugosum TaxID=416170 RepID=A0ABS4SF75_9PROT|nr:helix-turn-helix transcriptional regulator [Azospirillum rugosum]MBP2291065.1 transcriptional regulator with XRE-family HTH domain [Azospirillum rugosum]MDQ0524871.1 transcriptional regulator with XRE-family HTH domain [Azospirillum rugosum]